MLRWWRSVSTRIRALIALSLVVAGGAVLLAGVAALHDETKSASPPTPSLSVVPPATLTETHTIPGAATGGVSTVTITAPASTVLITSSTQQASGGDHDTTIAVALISAGALIIGSVITATSAILVAKVAKHA
jgi:hypothetical protein